MAALRACHVLRAAWLALAISACASGSIGDSNEDRASSWHPAGEDPPPGEMSGSAGVSGNSVDPKPGASAGSPAAVGGKSESPVASSGFLRLSHRQWAASVRDLLALDALPDVSGFSNDAPTGTSFDNNGGALVVSAALETDYEAAAEKQAADLVANSARLAKVAPAGWTGDAESFVKSFGERALRRPLSAAEVTSYAALWKRGPEFFPGADAKLAGVQITLPAFLLSPAFLYRVEIGKGSKNGVIDLTDYEIASRLSYMLWDSLPDAQLMAAAKAGELHDASKLAAQARRLLADPRAGEKLDEFHRQLLELRRYDSLHPAGLPDTIGASMRKETERFVHDVTVDQNGGLEQLLTASYSFVNKDLAAVYGLTGTFGSELTRVELNPMQRAGLLTQAGFLTYKSGDTAPILRGVFVNQKILCAELPPPPVFTPPKLMGETRRERVNSITGEGTCGANCHARVINPAGYPLEYFDDAGRYRTQDNGHAIDGSASYPFRGGAQMYSGPI
ncbi:MAG TPA: DUF1592 domain-containing protein, partial [Polyangiales bacterium]|nr:DUF1592 domain-containing protein [Polyangiales bacterium]